MMQTPVQIGLTVQLGLVAILATVATIATPTARAQAPVRELTRPMEFATGQDDNLYSLRRSQEDIHQWKRSQQELADGEFASAVERLHKLLQNEFGGVAPIAPGRFQGMRLAIVTTLANMSPKAQQAYEQLVAREAGYLAERQLHELMPEQLELLATRYPTSRSGRSARIHLGDVALETGNGAAAIGHYRRALDACAIGSTAERTVVDRMLAARTLIDPRTARAAAGEARLESAASAVLDVLPPSGDPTGHTAIGGGSDGRTPMSSPAGRPVRRGAEAVYANGFQNHDSGTFAMHVVGDLDGLYVNTGRQVLAFDPLRNEKTWATVPFVGDEDDTPQYRGRRRGWRSRRRPSSSGINHDMVLAAATSRDLVVAAVQVPERSANVDFHNNFRILSKIPRRRLFAFSRTTGKIAWGHFDGLDGPLTRRFRGHDACGPPLIVEDTIYVPIHDRSGAIAFSIAAYDLRTGDPKWRRLVCSSQQEVNMFGNARMEFAASPLAISDGVLYGASNLGVAFAVDAADGQTRWVTSHDVVEMPAASLRGQQERTVYFMNNAPVVNAGVVCMTPLDSPHVLGIDAETGRMLWRVRYQAPINGHEHDLRWLAGALDDEFILTGRGAIAVKARPEGTLNQRAVVRQLVSPEMFRRGRAEGTAGRPAITNEHLWVGRRGVITAFDRAGNPIARGQEITDNEYTGGNLVFVDGLVTSLRYGGFEMFYDRSAVLSDVEDRYRRAPDDPAAILRYATLKAALLPDSATPTERNTVTDLYREGLVACQRRGLARTHPVRRALQRELYDQASAAARAAVRRGTRDALELLAEARETAPDITKWIAMQQLVLAQCATYPRKLRTELDRLEREAAGELLPLPGGPQPVRAYVLYRRARLAGTEPPQAVAHWQDLLENYADATFAGTSARDHATRAIADLIRRHGESCYAAIATRASAALSDAGDDPEALRAVSTRYPNSQAATTARTRMLDRSVARGELGIACDVLAQDLARDAQQPRILRRVLVAAQKRGNLGLARALADMLAAHADVTSDWPEDGGRTYGAVLAELAPKLQPSPSRNRLGLPLHEIARIKPRTPRESFRLVATIAAEGFTRPADTPLFAVAGADLLAIDVHQPGSKPILFSHPVQFLEHIVLCGTTLIVPDLERVFAIDYRTGALRWQLEETDGQLLDGLGVQQGVFHVAAQPGNGEGAARFYGIEPSSGRVLFSRTLPGDRLRPVPKPIGDQLLVIQADAESNLQLLRLDPLSGKTLRTITPKQQFPEARGIATRIYPQGVLGDEQRIYLPIDSGDQPKLVAVDNRGETAWSWSGKSGRRLLMAALLDDRIVIVQGADTQEGWVTILRASTGENLRNLPLGYDIDVLNWQRSFTATPAPPALLLSDLSSPDGRERRFYCIGIAAGMPSFVESLSAGLDEVERRPQFGENFVTFGVRPNRGGPFRLYSLELDKRRGALPDGQKYRPLRLDATYALSAVGPYTVICCAEYLVVLGPEDTNR
ncbi:MAG: PQQ-binding-like beta-propeller repeat protein [bacterium]|nr:PQQ-binding-like beta-propeller repeat protein [bacterium]